MKTNKFTSNSLRSLANWLAMLAVKFFKLAADDFKNAHYFANKSEIVRDFLLNSPWLLYTIMYFALLIIDAFFMRPIIGVVVAHGFLLRGPIYLFLFIIVYIVLVSALTIGAAYGFAKKFDSRLRNLQVELDTVSRPGIARPVLMQEVLMDEKRDFSVGVFFSILLFVLLLCLSLYRSYLTNNFTIAFTSPADWINLILPIALAAALIFFGIYKDTLVRKLWFENKKKYFEKKGNSNYLAYEDHSRQAIEQDIEAEKTNEQTPSSADLLWIKKKHETTSNDPNYFDISHKVVVEISNKGVKVSGVQISALTADDGSLYNITDNEGVADLNWQSEGTFLKSILIGKFPIPGTRWFDGDTIKIDLTEILGFTTNSNHQPKLNQPFDVNIAVGT